MTADRHTAATEDVGLLTCGSGLLCHAYWTAAVRRKKQCNDMASKHSSRRSLNRISGQVQKSLRGAEGLVHVATRFACSVHPCSDAPMLMTAGGACLTVERRYPPEIN